MTEYLSLPTETAETAHLLATLEAAASGSPVEGERLWVASLLDAAMQRATGVGLEDAILKAIRETTASSTALAKG